MALTGLQIFKLLPKSNCKKCGLPTCLAFAMALAQKKCKLEDCPDASEEAKSTLNEAAAPPIRLIKFGSGDNEVQVGQETVMFRHEEKFHNPTIISVSVSDKLEGEALATRLKQINELQFERVGTHIQVNAVTVINESGSANTFAAVAASVKGSCKLALILASESPDAISAAVGKVGDTKPLLACATKDNAVAMAAIAKDNKCPLVAKAANAEDMAELTETIKAAGVEDIVMSLDGDSIKDNLYNLSKVRALALKNAYRPLGYPTLSHVLQGDADQQAVNASSLICKYSGIIVVETVERHAILAILTTIMNIFTDPQKPVQVEAKCYPIGEVTADSPVIFTTNFSLTYYSVESDVEASRVPCYILVVDTEGTSVLTAYSGDKLNDQIVNQAIKKSGLEDMVSHRKLIIPGYVAVMSGKLEETSGWEIAVGPRESSLLPKYLQEIA